MPAKRRTTKRAPQPPPPEGTVSLRVLVDHSERSFDEIRNALRAAGVCNHKGGAGLYKQSRVDAMEAEKALMAAGIIPDPDAEVAAAHAAPADAPADAPPPLAAPPFDPDKLAADAAAATATVPAPAPVIPTAGGGMGDPVPEHLLRGEMPEKVHGFPMPTNPDPDYTFWGIHINPNRQYAMRLKGWRFVDNAAYAQRIRPDGLYKSMTQPTGRIRYMDLELARLPKVINDRLRAERLHGQQERAATSRETLAANIDDTRRNLRQRMGPGGDKHIEYFEKDVGEVEDRTAHAAARRRGEATAPTTVDMGSRPR